MKIENKINNVIIIGGTTSLQKLLPIFHNNKRFRIEAVFLNFQDDKSSKNYCDINAIECYSYDQLPYQIKKFENLKIDWLFNINSTILLPSNVLKIPSKGALNLHHGILPNYAGVHTHIWAIRNEEKEFGVTLHWMEEGIDTGNIVYDSRFPLLGKETGLTLFLKCLKEGIKLIETALKVIERGGTLPSTKQDLSKRKLYTYSMVKNGRIDFCWSSNELQNFFRSANYKPFENPIFSPYFVLDKKRIYIDTIQEDISHPKLKTGHLLVTKDQTLIIGSKDSNFALKTDLSRTEFNKHEDLVKYILKSSKVVDE
jgi:methionyl-tRNA formyltransferase